MQKPDLVVLATRGRHGLPLWLKPSIAQAIASRTSAMTLFVPHDCRGIVSIAAGRFPAACCDKLISIPKFVIPAFFKRESKRDRTGPPIQTFGGDAPKIILIAAF